MPRSLPGNVGAALPGPEAEPSAWPGSRFGAFGTVLADGFGERVDLALEVRARRLIDRLHCHHADSAAHSVRVAEITMGMWRTAGRRGGELLSDVQTALLGSLLHDVGKLCVPREILASRHLLTEDERAAMASHSGKGASLLLAMGFPEPIAAVARGHHERWTGGGYPTGLPARSQPPIVRAVAVADAFDAMTDPRRAYRAPLGRVEALREVAACAGTHFEPFAAGLLAESLARPADNRPSSPFALPVLRSAPSAHPDLAPAH